MGIIRFLKKYKVAVALTVLMASIHFILPLSKDQKIQPIKGDAQAYYAYLPAAFIYQDFDFKFIKEINKKYYRPNDTKSFLIPSEKGIVNKTFPGAAIYYLPGFLIAHGLATIVGEADGYSSIYQWMFDLGYWLYVFLALLYLHKVLALLKFNEANISIALVLTALATNIFFYSVFNQSVTHILNLFTINLIVYHLLCYLENKTAKHLLLVIPLLALLGITRPTNILIFFFLPIFLDYRVLISQVWIDLKSIKNLVIAGVSSLIILSIPFLLWKAQTGHWIVYSYGEEGFNFSSPEILNFLFSYTKGWFLWTPFALIVVVWGGVLLFKSSTRKFGWMVVFIALAIYIFSSWWCWYYGAGQSQRVMIDYSLLLAYLTVIILRNIQFTTPKVIGLGAVFFGLVLLNITQAFQIYKGIYPHGSPTATQYWDNFMSLNRKAKVYPKSHWKKELHEEFDLKQAVVKGNYYEVEGDKIVHVAPGEEYSGNIALPELSLSKDSRLIIGFEARSRTDISSSRAVIDFQEKAETHVFSIAEYVEQDEWVNIEFKYEPFSMFKASPILYFWNGGTDEKVEIRNVKLSLYTTGGYM
ncbi:MAG: hypothetical protein MK078_07165 [Crocinitomicaceae bacterium]|nr:hypothetical protein [Crocinitomicaceae bacterium]